MNSFIQFLAPGQDLSVAYLSTYSVPLVTLSVLTAVFASFMALELSGRIANAASTAGKIVWLAPGALALGGGVWAMHFIGMLAFGLPCGISYDPVQTLVSMVPGVAASAVALWTISRTDVSLGKLILGGVLMGGGIGTMHYSGMAAMRLDAAIYYSPTIFALSIGFAIMLAILSLHAKFVLQRQRNFLPGWAKSIAAAVFMGVAISGMHYIAMEAAYFIPVGDSPGTVQGISPTVLAAGIGITTMMFVALTLAGSILGRHLETIHVLKREVREREQAENALRESEERFRALANYTPNKLHIKDTEGRYILINRKSEELFRVTNEEIKGKTAADIFPSEIGEAFNAHDRAVMETGKSVEAEERFFLDDGVHTFLTVKFPILGANNDIVAVGSSGFEISDRVEAEQALRASEERFRDFAESASDWLWETDENMRFTYLSEGIRDVIDKDLDIKKIIGKTRLEVAVDAHDDVEKWRRHMEDMEAHKPIRDFTYRFIRSDGETIYFSVDGNPVYDEQRNFRGYRGAGRNITEKILADEKIRASEERLSLIFESAAVPLAVIRLCDSVVLFANSAWLELFGRTAEEINTVQMEEMYVDITQRQDFLERLEAEGRVQGMVAQFKRKNGEAFYASFNSFKTRFDNEDVVISGLIDITDRIAGEKALRESERGFRLVIEKSPLPIAITEANGDIEYFNPKFVEIFGWTGDDIKTATDWWAAAYPDTEYRKRVAEAWEHAIAEAEANGEEIEVQQWCLTCKDGDEREVEFRMVPLTPNRHLIVMNDITERIRTDEELKTHRDHLEELVVQRTEEVQEKAIQLEGALMREKEYNVLQQRFVALVSHEFRTPLAIIDGAAQRLIRRKDKLDANDIETRANMVRSAVERMVGLIDTTLYASQLDAGKIEMKRTSNDIGELLLDVCERQAEIASDHQFDVEVQDLPEKMLIDHGLLDLVFTNLLSNAVKYAPQAPHIGVKGWQENGNAIVTVTDHGVGIPKGELPHMFNRFFRASTAEGYKGTGLGLSVCKEFVEMHGGTIEVASVEGEGTTFTVRLPIKQQNSPT